MIARLVSFEMRSDTLRLRSGDANLLRRGPAKYIAVERMHDDGVTCHVVATIELQEEDEAPVVRFVGMRPFDQDRDEFWELTRLGCELMKGVRPGRTSLPNGDERQEKP